jgi:hypothetical protein
MEGGVEAGDLRQRRRGRGDGADRRRLLGWCSGASGTSASSFASTAFVDAHRRRVVGAAVDDAMADRARLAAGRGSSRAARTGT